MGLRDCVGDARLLLSLDGGIGVLVLRLTSLAVPPEEEGGGK